MTKQVDVFGIILTKYTHPNGIRWRYRERGMGPTCDAFWQWMDGREILDRYNDWPWSWWSFVNPRDDVEIRLRWMNYIGFDDDQIVDTEL